MPRLTSFVLRHRLLVVVFWVVLAGLGGATVSTTTDRLTQSFAGSDSPAERTARRMAEVYHTDDNAEPNVVVLTLPAGQTVDARVGETFAVARQLGARVVDYSTTGDRAFVTDDGRGTYALVFLPPGAQFTPEFAGRLTEAVRGAAPPGATVQVTGLGPLQEAADGSEGTGLLAETIIGAVGALLVMAFVFASLVAVLPLVMAGVAILTTFLLVLGLTAVTDVNFVAQFLVGLIGLGVAIDYALLVVTRWREERTRQPDNRAAVEAAMRHAGRAVVFSGLTVTIGLLALVVLPVPAMRGFAYAGALVPLVSVAVAVTLLPVLLDVVGPRLDWPRLRTERSASRGWTAWARGVVRWRWVAAAAGLAALLALAAPMLHLQLGDARTAALGQPGPARTGLDSLIAGGIPSGVLTPAEVLVRDGAGPAVAANLARLPGVVTAVAPDDQRAGGLAVVVVLPAAEAGSDAGQVTIGRIRDAVAGEPDVLGVAGTGAAQVDFENAVYGRFPVMLVVVCLLTFLLLARAFRSLVLPLKAVLLNVVSLGAAYGILVVVWQDGHGSEEIWDTASTGAIPVWIPLVVFAFLFGLSMDYEVFLLARMREAYDDGEDTDRAVVTGLSRTGRLVTCAALILVLAFLSMSTAPETDVRVLATGLGAGILVDATVVRCLLVPTLVSLFGRWNWWLPGFAARLLRVDASPLVEPAAEPRPLQPASSRRG
jgi:putative drug exporter of the RND superfamily